MFRLICEFRSAGVLPFLHTNDSRPFQSCPALPSLPDVDVKERLYHRLQKSPRKR